MNDNETNPTSALFSAYGYSCIRSSHTATLGRAPTGVRLGLAGLAEFGANRRAQESERIQQPSKLVDQIDVVVERHVFDHFERQKIASNLTSTWDKDE